MTEQDEDAWPPGEPLIRQLVAALQADGFACATPDTCGDSGWSVTVDIGDAHLELAVSGGDQSGVESRWFGGLYVHQEPGTVRRPFGAKVVDRTAEILRAARVVDRTVRSLEARDIRWRVDNPPDDKHHTPEPT